ncbi:MAG TPA: hypothetical protein VGO40_11750 [Longimicrobium sp.]|jgi:hypothetical protein|nr:hypothetical protein [Longimicrobium sp.]
MRKLVLDLDDLEIESFEASRLGEGSGTVHGREASNTWCPTNCLSDPCYCGISDNSCSCVPC